MSKKTTPIQRKINIIDKEGNKVKRKLPKVVKSKCCKKYQKGENKRCKKCPCYDLIKQVA